MHQERMAVSGHGKNSLPKRCCAYLMVTHLLYCTIWFMCFTSSRCSVSRSSALLRVWLLATACRRSVSVGGSCLRLSSSICTKDARQVGQSADYEWQRSVRQTTSVHACLLVTSREGLQARTCGSGASACAVSSWRNKHRQCFLPEHETWRWANHKT